MSPVRVRPSAPGQLQTALATSAVFFTVGVGSPFRWEVRRPIRRGTSPSSVRDLVSSRPWNRRLVGARRRPRRVFHQSANATHKAGKYAADPLVWLAKPF